MRPPALVGAIPPIDPWIGNRFLPPQARTGKCDRCGDVTFVARITVHWNEVSWFKSSDELSNPSNALVRHHCAWCWIAYGWEQKRPLAKRPKMTIIGEIP